MVRCAHTFVNMVYWEEYCYVFSLLIKHGQGNEKATVTLPFILLHFLLTVLAFCLVLETSFFLNNFRLKWNVPTEIWIIITHCPLFFSVSSFSICFTQLHFPPPYSPHIPFPPFLCLSSSSSFLLVSFLFLPVSLLDFPSFLPFISTLHIRSFLASFVFIRFLFLLFLSIPVSLLVLVLSSCFSSLFLPIPFLFVFPSFLFLSASFSFLMFISDLVVFLSLILTSLDLDWLQALWAAHCVFSPTKLSSHIHEPK